MNKVIEAAKAVLAAFERDAKTEYQRFCERELRLAIREAEKPQPELEKHTQGPSAAARPQDDNSHRNTDDSSGNTEDAEESDGA